jgi:hypothetical protein
MHKSLLEETQLRLQLQSQLAKEHARSARLADEMEEKEAALARAEASATAQLAAAETSHRLALEDLRRQVEFHASSSSQVKSERDIMRLRAEASERRRGEAERAREEAERGREEAERERDDARGLRQLEAARAEHAERQLETLKAELGAPAVVPALWDALQTLDALTDMPWRPS